jgi:hypothetical protein
MTSEIQGLGKMVQPGLQGAPMYQNSHGVFQMGYVLHNDKKNCPSTIMSSGVTIDQVYQEIKKIREDMVKREDLEALVDTVEILSNPATMQAIKKSDQNIRQGRVKTITSVDDLL